MDKTKTKQTTEDAGAGSCKGKHKQKKEPKPKPHRSQSRSETSGSSDDCVFPPTSPSSSSGNQTDSSSEDTARRKVKIKKGEKKNKLKGKKGVIQHVHRPVWSSVIEPHRLSLRWLHSCQCPVGTPRTKDKKTRHQKKKEKRKHIDFSRLNPG